MANKSTDQTPITLKSVLLAIFALAALGWWGLDRAQYFIARSILVAYGDVESTFRAAWFEWDGDLYAKDFNIIDEETGETVLHADYVVAETPGWFWVARNLFTKKRKHRIKVDRIHLELLNVRGHEELLDPSLGDLGPFSTDAASPFDAEGCKDVYHFSRYDYEALGLPPAEPKLVFDYQIDGSQLDVEVRLEVAGVSTVRATRKETLLGGSNALVLDYMSTEIGGEHVEVVDAGFVKARNQFCAQAAGIDESAFVQRHMDTVQRLMQHYGVQMDADSMAAYRRFARDGGTLGLNVVYSPALPSEVFYEARGSTESLSQMTLRMERDEQSMLTRLTPVRERPLAGMDSRLPTWLLMEREQAALAQQEGGRTAPTPLPMAASGTTTAPVATAPVATAPVALKPSPPAPPSEPVRAPASGDDDDWIVRGRDPEQLDWNALRPLVGKQVRLYTQQGGARVVELLEHGPEQLKVRAQMVSGSAEYTVRRAQFRYARTL